MYTAVQIGIFGVLIFSAQLCFAEYKSEILEYGYYAKISEPTRYRNYASTSGFVKEGGEVRLVEQVDRIPVAKNRLFGFKFKLSGIADKKSVQLKLVVKHPEIVRPNGSKTSEYSYPVIMDVKEGSIVNQTGYSIDHDYEMVEGDWIFELWYNNQMLISKTFTTFLPEDGGK